MGEQKYGFNLLNELLTCACRRSSFSQCTCIDSMNLEGGVSQPGRSRPILSILRPLKKRTPFRLFHGKRVRLFVSASSSSHAFAMPSRTWKPASRIFCCLRWLCRKFTSASVVLMLILSEPKSEHEVMSRSHARLQSSDQHRPGPATPDPTGSALAQSSSFKYNVNS